MAKIPFFGSAYTARSLNADCQALFDLYPEIDETQQGKSVGAFYGTPGIENFATLPTSPCRGLWPGDHRLFVVYGSRLYEIFGDASFHDRGDVGDDLQHSPVYIFPNSFGGQLLIISAGKVFVDVGGIPNGSGVVNVTGTAVTWVSGDVFNTTMVGNGFQLNGVIYYVASLTDNHHLTLTSAPGSLADAQYQALLDSGAQLIQPFWPNGTGMVMTHGALVVLLSGDAFDSSLVGETIVIGGTDYVVQSVTDGQHLVLTSSAGTLGTVAWSVTVAFAGYVWTEVVGTTFVAHWVDGSLFTQSMVGQTMTINGSPYVVSGYVKPTEVLLATSPGNQGGIAYSAAVPFSGQLYAADQPRTGLVSIDIAGHVTLTAGDRFLSTLAVLNVAGTNYPVASFTDDQHLALTGWAGGAVTNKPYAASAPLDAGTVDVDPTGLNVTLDSGDNFDPYLTEINIDGNNFPVAAVTDSTHLVLAQGATSAAGVLYAAAQLRSGLVDVDATGLNVTLDSGDTFTAAMSVVNIGGSNYPVASFLNSAHLTLATSTGGPLTTVAYYATQSLNAGTVNVDSTGLNVSLAAGDNFDSRLTQVDVAGNNYPVGSVTSGTQLILTSGPTVPPFATGNVAVGGTNVERLSGPYFTSAWVGAVLTINLKSYTVASVTDRNTLVLTTSAGNQGSVTYSAGWSASGLGASYLTALTRLSGDSFDPSMNGSTITVDGHALVVDSVTDANDLTLTTSMTLGGVTYEAQKPVTAITGTFLDSFALISQADSQNVYFSAPGDFTSWDAADVFTKESYPDHVGRLFADHEGLAVFGNLESVEVWRTALGGPVLPFGRDDSGAQHYGLAAPNSVARLANGFGWLAYDVRRGGCQAMYAQGFQSQRVSTHAIEETWRTYPTITDCVAYSYTEDGHNFWVLNFPSGDATWVYDATASQQANMPMWHRRAYWDGSALHRQRQSFYAYTGLGTPGRPPLPAASFVGDWETGDLYTQSLDYLSDDGDAIVRQRTCPYIATSGERIFIDHIELDAQAGPVAYNVVFDVSKDYGHSFTLARTRTAEASDYAKIQRLMWWRGGQARAFVLRFTVTSSDADIAFINGYGDPMPGQT